MTAKRLFDLAVAIPALIILSPLMIGIAIWIRLDSSGPAIFRQERIGRDGVPFDILKFRTMIERKVDGGSLISKTSDERITRSGSVLRRLKIDELPQLVNVIAGQMSIVGPRPEVRKYVEHYPESARRKILSVRPGITDNAAILFRNESDLLESAIDPESEYITKILPKKIEMYEDYVDEWSLYGDLTLILKTLLTLFLPVKRSSNRSS